MTSIHNGPRSNQLNLHHHAIEKGFDYGNIAMADKKSIQSDNKTIKPTFFGYFRSKNITSLWEMVYGVVEKERNVYRIFFIFYFYFLLRHSVLIISCIRIYRCCMRNRGYRLNGRSKINIVMHLCLPIRCEWPTSRLDHTKPTCINDVPCTRTYTTHWQCFSLLPLVATFNYISCVYSITNIVNTEWSLRYVAL